MWAREKNKNKKTCYHVIFWKTKEWLPKASIICCKKRRRHTNLRIRPQRMKEVGRRYIHTKLKKIPDISNINKISNTERQQVKVQGDVCCFKCENSTKIQETWRMKVMSSPKENNNHLVKKLKNKEYFDLSYKKVKIVVLRKINSYRKTEKNK